ncbi:MAG: MBL fold metallo-hydrolase [Halovenus sp.]
MDAREPETERRICHPVERGVMERIRLSNHTFEGANNAYLFADGPETVLVDTGDRVPATREQLTAALADHDVEFADIDRIFLTHWHGDHSGLAGAIQRESDADVYVHEADAPLVAGDEAAWTALEERQREFFDSWGMPPADRAALERFLDDVTLYDQPPTVTTVADGDTFVVNDTRLEVVHAPGHADGLCMFEAGAEVLTGDALLPEYTPNVGGADIRVERPLAKYLDTLAAIVAADYDRAWPGHRIPIDDPAARAEHIIDHHEERSYRVLEAVERLAPCDVWSVSADLFGSLEGIHIIHGPGEAYAHLDHLECMGAVTQADGAYRLADGTAGRLDAIEEERWELT